MSFYWGCRTDEEVVARVRYWHRIACKWQRVFYAFLALAILALLAAAVVGESPTLVRRLEKFGINFPFMHSRSYSAGYLSGFAGGIFLGAALAWCILGLLAITVDIRRDRLLFAYHDRLREAGLLPAEASGKMENDHQSIEA